MKKILYFLFFYVLFLTINSFGQTPPDTLQGVEFRTWVKANFYDGKHNQLGYDAAREKMFAYIDNVNDTVISVYSGYKRYNAYGNEVTYLDKWTSTVIVNTEHTVPQSFFDGEPMKSDLCHLFPSYANWNSKRGNLPFAEIPDNVVNEWYKGDHSYTTKPQSDPDSYSKLQTNVAFEPRLAHKGDLARAAFYFYTMYPDVSGGLEQLGDPQTFFKWHNQDHISEYEKDRNDLVETYQKNRNPYIDHPEWVSRAWGFTSENIPDEPLHFQITPNQDKIDISWSDVENEEGYLLFRKVNSGNFTEYQRIENDTTYTDIIDPNNEYSYYLMAWNYYGVSKKTPVLSYHYTAINPENTEKVADGLSKFYPNPFNSSGYVYLEVPRVLHYSIAVYNINGKRVSRLFDGQLSTGVHKFQFHPDGLSSGIYFITIKNGLTTKTIKSLYFK